MATATNSGHSHVPSDPTRRTAAIRIPFPARLNPHAERARRHTIQWILEKRLLTGDSATSEYDALRLERLMAYFYPDATGSDLELAADFNAWFFIFDDQFDGRLGMHPVAVEQLVGSLGRTMRAGSAPHPFDPPLVQSFQDIWLRATAGRPDHWRRRFREHWLAYMAAHRGEALNRNADRLPAPEQFLELRRHSIGVQPCLDFTERCGGYTLPDDLHGSQPLREMREITADVVIFVNDIVSLVKELAVGDVNNSVVVLREQKGCTLEEAVEFTATLANERTARFTALVASLPRTLGERRVPADVRWHVDHYVEGMAHLMAGNLAWSLATSRYDERGIAAVSGGRRRPWANLVANAGTSAEGLRTEPDGADVTAQSLERNG